MPPDMLLISHEPGLEASSVVHSFAGTGGRGLGTTPSWPSFLSYLELFIFGVLPCLGKRNFTGPRIILSVMEGPELLIPQEESLCREKAMI